MGIIKFRYQQFCIPIKESEQHMEYDNQLVALTTPIQIDFIQIELFHKNIKILNRNRQRLERQQSHTCTYVCHMKMRPDRPHERPELTTQKKKKMQKTKPYQFTSLVVDT